MDRNQRLAFQAQLLDITHEAVIAYDAGERIVYWNPGAERTYGWTESEALGNTARELLHVEIDGAPTREERLAVLRRGSTLGGQALVRRKDGAELSIEFNARGIFDEDGEFSGYVSVHRDITDRQRAEQAVRESEAHLRALVEASPLGIVMMDPQGHPTFYNPKCAELHGLALDEARGEAWANAVHPEDRERVAASWYAAASAGRAWADTYRFRHADGKVVWVSGRAAPIRIEGRLVGFVGTLEDISAERAAREAAERALLLRDEMLAIVAHDLRSPLSTIVLAAQALLAREAGEGGSNTSLELLLRSAQSMERLICDLLDVSRAEAGRFTVARARVDLAALVREAAELFAVQARSRGVSLAAEVDPGVPEVEGDRHRLTQVLSNLLGNALRYTPPSGRVTLRARPHAAGALLSAEDTGSGIPAEDLPRLFDRFWQGERGAHSGAGLGLAIAKAIVEAHGGRIWAESAPGAGTAVHFTLPRELTPR